MKIKSLTIATGQGVKIYEVGNKMGDIATIKEEDIFFQGDPFTHYIGRDSTGNELLRVHNSVPVVIDFDYQ